MKLIIFSILAAVISVLCYFYIINFKIQQPQKLFTYWPIVIDMWNKNDNLRTIHRVFQRLGYEMANGSEEHW